jgi:ABC-2 type transport system ATP-binding protein
MKSVVGVIKIDEGKIIFDGKDITENEVFLKKILVFCQKTTHFTKKCM